MCGEALPRLVLDAMHCSDQVSSFIEADNVRLIVCTLRQLFLNGG